MTRPAKRRQHVCGPRDGASQGRFSWGRRCGKAGRQHRLARPRPGRVGPPGSQSGARLHQGFPDTWEVSRLLRHLPRGSTGDHGPGPRTARGAPPCGANCSPHRRYRAASAREGHGKDRETSECSIVPSKQGKPPQATLWRKGGTGNTDLWRERWQEHRVLQPSPRNSNG